MATRMYDTLEQQVRGETSSDFIYRNFTTQCIVKNEINANTEITIPFESLSNKYRYFLEQHVLERELTELQYDYFRHNPQALSDSLYGTTQFWGMLLELNNCTCRTEFDLMKIKYYDPSTIREIMNEIILREDEMNS